MATLFHIRGRGTSTGYITIIIGLKVYRERKHNIKHKIYTRHVLIVYNSDDIL